MGQKNLCRKINALHRDSESAKKIIGILSDFFGSAGKKCGIVLDLFFLL
jgi:hypothetical protein